MPSTTSSDACAESGRYARLEALVRQRFGIDLGRYSEAAVARLLEELPTEIEPSNLDMLSRLVAACSVGETMFLRHVEQFTVAAEESLALVSRERRALRVWSAGCATGEEAYSLAAVLSRAVPFGVEVIATDMNPESLERARGARYRPWSLRGVDLSSVEAWLDVDGLDVNVRPHVRELVSFSHHNLIDGPYPENVDIVFCRNVLLYFEEEAARDVHARFERCLVEGGLLFLGPCDPSPSSGGSLREDWSGCARFHRKTARASEPSHDATVARRTVRRALSTPPRGVDGRRPDRAAEHREEIFSLVRAFSGQRDFLRALALLDELASVEPFDPDVHVIAAMIHEEAGEPEAALASARRAMFLQPDAPIAHFLMGSCLTRLEAESRARVHFRTALAKLNALSSCDSTPIAEGLTAAQLRRMIHARLDR